MAKWYERDPARFEIGKRLLAQFHPGMKLVIQKGILRFRKQVVTARNTYQVEGIFGASHPYDPMAIFIRHPPLKQNPPHRFSGGRICLHGQGDIGPETTAKMYLDWTIQWLKTYEAWLAGKSWPKTNRSCTSRREI